MRNALDFWRGFSWGPDYELETAAKFNPACDIEETESQYLLSFDLPGVSKEDVKIEIADDQLMVSGERKYEANEKGARHIVERFHGAFHRAFALPDHVNAEKVEANYQDGVLRIAIPKAEATKPRRIEINLNSATKTSAA